MKRRELLLSLPAALLAGCRRRPPGQLRTLSVSVAEHLSLSPFYLAMEEGYFGEAGFEVELVRLGGIQALPLLAGGKLDVSFGGLSASVLNAVARGMRIRVVAGREFANPGCGESLTLYAHRAAFGDGPIDPRRLRGKRFSIRLRGITEFVLDVFLKQHGLESDDVQKVDLPLSEALAALAANRIDAFMDAELAQSPLSVSPDLVKLWRLVDALPGHQYSFILFGESLLEAPVETGARFLAAYLEGAKRFLEGVTPRFMIEFAEKHGLDLQKTVSACRATFAPDGAIDLASIERIIEWNFTKGYATERLEPSRLIDTRFIEEARQMVRSGAWRLAPGKVHGARS